MIDKERFEQKSGRGCSYSHYVARTTTCCGSFFIEDVELSQMYIDAANLNRTIELLYDPRIEHPPKCPFCGGAEWDYDDAPAAQIPAEWRWAVTEPDSP